MPKLSSAAQLSVRLAAIESELKEKIAQKKASESALKFVHNNKLLSVRNSNGTFFMMHIPAGDSPCIEGLAARRINVKALCLQVTTPPDEIRSTRRCRSSTL